MIRLDGRPGAGSVCFALGAHPPAMTGEQCRFAGMMNARAEASIVPEGRPFDGHHKQIKA
jgi:hypothetical protein